MPLHTMVGIKYLINIPIPSTFVLSIIKLEKNNDYAVFGLLLFISFNLDNETCIQWC